MTKAVKVVEETAAEPRPIARAEEKLPAKAPSLWARMEELLAERMRTWPGIRPPRELIGVPPVDVYDAGAELIVKAELPGTKREEVEVRLDGALLTIAGTKEKEEKVERRNYYRYERSTGAFSRTVRLPVELVPEKVTAKLEHGVLEIRGPKVAGAMPETRKIEVG